MNYAAPIEFTGINEEAGSHTGLDDCIVLDIGGSLAKLAYVVKYSYTTSIPKASNESTAQFHAFDYQNIEKEGFRICFVKFETSYIEDCIEFIKNNILTNQRHPRALKVTGGGAYRFVNVIEEKLNVKIEKLDEIYCIVKGAEFLLCNIPDEAYTYNKKMSPAEIFETSLVQPYPFLLVNIGSGVSIVKVDGPDSYQRVGGTSIGGGTFWGLAGLLTKGKYNFDEMLSLTKEGDHRNVDMLVKDIYGQGYESLGLSGDVIASSFGLTARNPDTPKTDADMLKSLLITVSNNIGQLSYLYAKIHDMTRIIFGGFFIRNNSVTMESISYGVNFWSQGKMKALFLRHEGYLGAVGAFTKCLNEISPNLANSSWFEHYRIMDEVENINECVRLKNPDEAPNKASVSLVEPKQLKREGSSKSLVDRRFSLNYNKNIEFLELDSNLESSFVAFPLLSDPQGYKPDTLEISQDKVARDYWLSSVQKMIERFEKKAIESQGGTRDAEMRAKKFVESYLVFLEEKRQRPSEKGAFTIRALIDAMLKYLRAYDFPDPFMDQKKLDNFKALSAVKERLDGVHKLSNLKERHLNIFKGLFAGNIYDWGSQEAIETFDQETPDSFIQQFDSMIQKLQERPWLIDDFDKWTTFIENKKSSIRSVLIFVDNSGPDLILGIIPFVLEALRWNNGTTKVIIAANKEPSINDVTINELTILIENISNYLPEIKEALASNRLLLVDNGHASPFLDFRQVSRDLSHLTETHNVDLIILEGMGRAIHTNLFAQFKVPSLKLAVIKNSWLAARLGGGLFSVVFKFENPIT